MKEPQNQLRGLSVVMICFALSPLQLHAFFLYFSKMFCQSFTTPGFECITFKGICGKNSWKKDQSISAYMEIPKHTIIWRGRNPSIHQAPLEPCQLITDLLVVLLQIFYTFYRVQFVSGCPVAWLDDDGHSQWSVHHHLSSKISYSLLGAYTGNVEAGCDGIYFGSTCRNFCKSHTASKSRIILKDTFSLADK